jgi:hypothetical protein
VKGLVDQCAIFRAAAGVAAESNRSGIGQEGSRDGTPRTFLQAHY